MKLRLTLALLALAALIAYLSNRAPTPPTNAPDSGEIVPDDVVEWTKERK